MLKRGEHIILKKIKTTKPESNVKVGSIIEGYLLDDIECGKKITLIDYTIDGEKHYGNLVTTVLMYFVNKQFYHTKNSIYEKL